MDSVYITEHLRDTIVTIQSDSSMIKALLECDSLGQVHLKELLNFKEGKNIKPPTLTLFENQLTATAHVDSISIYLQLKDRYKESFRTETVTKTVEVNKLTWWQSLWIKVGKASLSIIIIYIIFKLIKHKSL